MAGQVRRVVDLQKPQTVQTLETASDIIRAEKVKVAIDPKNLKIIKTDRFN
jgi:hypothetical protein